MSRNKAAVTSVLASVPEGGSGEEGALRDFAAKTLPTLQEHKARVDELTGS